MALDFVTITLPDVPAEKRANRGRPSLADVMLPALKAVGPGKFLVIAPPSNFPRTFPTLASVPGVTVKYDIDGAGKYVYSASYSEPVVVKLPPERDARGHFVKRSKVSA